MDALDLIAKIKMDLSEYEDGLDKAKKDAEKGGGGIGKAFGKVASVGGKVMAGFAKVTAVATGAAMAGVGALVTKSVEAYGEYEQLVGGVQKLYGNMGMSLEQYAGSVGKSVADVEGEYQNLEKAQNMVLENAKNAYKTAGMSANQYMDTATSFSAALINSLGGDTVKAAEQTDVAMRAISDNFNTFGGDIGMIQGAFQGFAKQNYTMLDNLKLGYGGTKTEMERLIADANEYAASIGKASDLSIDSFSDVVTAIDLIQQKQQIAGTTAREATTTIQGSLGTLKAAWENLLTGMGDKNADMSKLINNLVESLVGGVKVSTNGSVEHVKGFLDNLLPVVENALSSIGTLVQQLIPKALKIIPGLISDVLPKLTAAATELVQGLVSALSDNMETISGVINQLIEALVKLLPEVIKLGGEIVATLGTAIMDNLDSILDAAGQILEMLLKGLSEHAGDVVNAAIQIVTMLANFLTENIDLIVSATVQIAMGIAQALVDNIDVLLTAAFDLITAFAEAIIENIPVIIEVLPELIQGVIDGLVAFLPEMVDAWIKLMDCLEEALPQIMESLALAVAEIIVMLVEYWTGPGFQQTMKAAMVMFNALLKALAMVVLQVVANVGMFIRNIGSQIAGAAGQVLSSAVTAFMGLVQGLANVIPTLLTNVRNLMTDAGNAIKEKLSNFTGYGRDMIQNFINGISEKMGALKGKVSDVASLIRSMIHFSEPDVGPLSDFSTYAPDMMKLFMQGITDNEGKLQKTVADAFDFKDSITSPQFNGSVASLTAKTTEITPAGTTQQAINDNTPINLYITNEVDGKRLNENSYTYTVGRMRRETDAIRIAHGGA